MSGSGELTIVACIKISPDTAQLRADPEKRSPRLEDAPRRIGVFEENALEEAVRLRERHGGRVIALTLAASPPAELIHRALAMGADEACVIEDSGADEADALATATILAAAFPRLPTADLVICGEGSLDAYSRQVGPRLAEALGLPVVTHASCVEIEGRRLVAHRALEQRNTILEVDLPAVVTVGQEINEPRFPTVLQIMGASRKPSVTWTLADLGFDTGATAAGMSGLRTLETFAPLQQRRCLQVEGEGPAELARDLARRLSERGLVRVE